MPKLQRLTSQERDRFERMSHLRASPGHESCKDRPESCCENCLRLIAARAALRLDNSIAKYLKEPSRG